MVDHCRWFCRSEKLAKQATVSTGLTQIYIHLNFFKSVLSCFLKQCAYESIKSHWFDFSSLEKKRLPLRRTAGWQPVGLTHISPDNNLVWPSPFGNRHSAFGTSWCSLPKKSILPSLNNNCHNLILIASSIYTFQALGPIFPGPDCLGNDWTPFTTFLNNWTIWAVYLLKCPQRNTSLFCLYPFIHPQTEWLFGLELEGGKAWNGEQLVLQ